MGRNEGKPTGQATASGTGAPSTQRERAAEDTETVKTVPLDGLAVGVSDVSRAGQLPRQLWVIQGNLTATKKRKVGEEKEEAQT